MFVTCKKTTKKLFRYCLQSNKRICAHETQETGLRLKLFNCCTAFIWISRHLAQFIPVFLFALKRSRFDIRISSVTFSNPLLLHHVIHNITYCKNYIWRLMQPKFFLKILDCPIVFICPTVMRTTSRYMRIACKKHSLFLFSASIHRWANDEKLEYTVR